MRSYTICLPILFADSRRSGQKSARQRWTDRKEKWAEWASEAGRQIDFELWDESELAERLGRPEHLGRVAFWFGGTAFDLEWFAVTGVNPAIRQANTRYIQPLHFDVPLQQTLEAIQKENFRDRLVEQCEGLRSSMEEELVTDDEIDSDQFRNLRSRAQELVTILPIGTQPSEADIARLPESVSALVSALVAAEDALWAHGLDLERDVDFNIDQLWRLRSKLKSLHEFLNSAQAVAARTGRLIVTGEAGAGKTHLLCQTARQNLEHKTPAILLLGEQFPGLGEPWREIQELLGLNCSRDEFLGALDAAGEAYGKRVVIMIDALNEGPGLLYWRKHLGAMLEQSQRYPFLALIFSIRDVYAADLRRLVTNECAWAEHHGFRGRVASAARHFFRHYGLAEPNVPVLDPEYENPLFLKLLCEALVNRDDIRLSDPPSFGSLLQMVLDDANSRLAAMLDYDPAERYVHRAVSLLSDMMASSQNDWIAWPTAIENLRSLRPSTTRAQCLAHHLLSEDLLTKIPLPGSKGGEEIVRFSYQRFSDYLIVTDSIQRELDAGGDGSATMTRELENLGWSTTARNWLEAAAIISPELGGVELPDVIPNFAENSVTYTAFLNSIVWRNRTAVTSTTKRHIASLLSLDNEDRHIAFETLLAVATRPDHPLNGDWLDQHLGPMQMADRDSTWSTAIFGGWERESNIHRLIEWAWQDGVATGLPIDVVRLASYTLVWMFTTSDRFVRDRATKAAVSLLEGAIPSVRHILEHFNGIDEPYLQERLYAVVCGVALRTTNLGGLEDLAQDVYDRIFRNGSPPASILLRDHARAVVEVALHNGCNIEINPRHLLPPYCSIPPATPPTLQELQAIYQYEKYDRKNESLSRIYHSVTGDDFNHYVIKDVMQWSGRLGGLTAKDSPRRLFEAIKARANASASRILNRLDDHYRFLDNDRLCGQQRTSIEGQVKELEALLPAIFGKIRCRLFLTRIKPFLLNRYSREQRDYFDLELFERLILQRVQELGWRSDLHGEFDSRVKIHGRESRKAERLGKKYQWIAYDELHARISDNYGLADDTSSSIDKEEWRLGTWTSNYRDLDPTLLLRGTKADGWGVNLRNWWTPHDYNQWNSKASFADWIKATEDIPPPEEFLKLSDSKGKAWMLLDGSQFWRRNVERRGDFKAERDRQELHLIFRSYLVRAADLDPMLAWGARQNWINDRLPSASFDYRAHLFEHYCSSRFGGDFSSEWCDEVWPDNDVPCPFLQTSAEYLCEHNTYDCSLDSSVRISIPSRWLAEKLSLTPAGRYADFVDPSGEAVTFDPSTRESGKSVLLIRQDSLVDLLARENLAIVWTLLGEKNYYTPDYSKRNYGRLTLLGIYSTTAGDIAGSYRTEFEEGRS